MRKFCVSNLCLKINNLILIACMSVCTVPPLTFPLVAMADVERPVIPVIQEDMRTINQVIPNEGELGENTTNINLK